MSDTNENAGVPIRNAIALPVPAAFAFPALETILKKVCAASRERFACGSQLELDGRYAVPFGAFGHVVDRTILRGAAEESLRRFLHDVAGRITSLSRWASSA